MPKPIRPELSEPEARAALRGLADELPIEHVRWLLAAMRRHNPLLYSLFTVPEDDEPETEEERAVAARGRADIAAGRFMTTEQLRERLRRTSHPHHFPSQGA